MSRSIWAAMILLGAACIGSAALASHYHRRAARFEARWQEASAAASSLERAAKQRRDNAPDVVLEYPGERPALAAAAGDGGDAEVDAMRTQLQELQESLVERDRRLAALQERATNRPARAPDRGRFSRDSMAELQRTDPERYAEIVKQREDMRKAVNESFAKQAAHLLESDASTLSQDEAAQRAQMLQLVNDTWKLSAQLMSTTPPENRREVMGQIHDNLHTLQPMLDAERNRELQQLALDSGYPEGESQLFVDYVNSVIDATSTHAMRRSMWRGGPPPGPPPGAPPAP